ncbi:hypothetical protein A3D88_03570 [Candidatus Peribacteria bacterium RIFCSPHIGHO2_02_FULL_52_16]|nr:MAG: hypothetical protein A2706_04385 [Candidatus Peribacteria bacterium RIFCSPHIGHO2_01_FULL_51_35]OGJ61763.1 MAG: hypothetical protein A3D88_03570 [Candidatus Peribacteria bacterium RIFCSPHIGHO2_02_FULL_52_16]
MQFRFSLLGLLTLLVACTAHVPTEKRFEDWEMYTNETYGFSVKHPPETTVQEEEGYIRLQNYTDYDDVLGLQPGQYYLEIHLPKDPAQEGFATCEDDFAQRASEPVAVKEVSVGDYTGYRGPGEEGGDAGGTRHALCIETPDRYFYVQATENSDAGLIANAILDSFSITE